MSAECNNNPICLPGYPEASTPMRYINTGTYMGTADAILSLIQDMERVLITAEAECPLHLVDTTNRRGKVNKRMCFNDQYAGGRLFLSNRDK